MKRTLRLSLSVTAAVALATSFFYFGSPKLPVAVQAQIESVTAPVIEQIKETLAPVDAVAAIAAEQVIELIKGVPPQEPGVSTVLLSEPVVIIGDGREALPKGTPVRLIKQQGPYVQVQHESRLITIPRTSMALGAYRAN